VPKFIRHESCPECGSSDGLAVYDDNKHCFVCQHHEGEGKISDKHPIKHAENRDVTPLPGGEQVAIKDRGLTAGSVNKYKVTVNTNPESTVGHVYPYFDEDGSHVANKVRRKGEKAFYWEGDVGRGVLFGQQLFPAGGKAITIVEGECDALAGFQLTGSRYPCVSVKSSSEAKKNCVDSFEYLNSFEKVVIVFDSDEPGQKAAQQVAQLFQPGKAHIVKLEKAKDPNDYLMQGLEKEYVNEWFRAPAFMPDGLKIGSDMWGEIENHVVPKSTPYPWKGLNHTTYGMRLSEFVLLTADTGVGKTSVVKEIEYSLLTNPDLIEAKAGVGILHLEEPNYDTLIGLMSVDANKPFHLPDTERTNEELRQHFDKVINTERVVIWDHFGSNDIDAVLSKIRHMAALGCQYIILDHLSIVVSDQSGDERKQLDEISTKMKMLCMNLNIAVIGIIHINRNGQVRGSAGPEQVSNIVIKLHRDKTDPDPWRRNITRLTVEKNRFCGRTGPSCWLFYNEITGRLEELDPDQVEVYEKGLSQAGNEFEMFAK
jgi:twinkle protein